MTKQEIKEILQMPREEYEKTIRAQAFETMLAEKKGVCATAMLGYSNICKNQCLYCGMRASNHLPKRYRYHAEQIVELASAAYQSGLRRLFLISGEDPKFPFEDILSVIQTAKAMGFERVSLCAGEFSRSQYEQMKAAGLDEYVMKFEMSHKDTFERLNPSTTFEKRNKAITWIQEAGLDLGSGNIVDYPGQTLEELVDDIWLMKELNVSWAPNIPYMPAAGTPLAQEGGPGRIDLMHREISLVRLLLPRADITAQQPGKNLKNGLGDTEGNLWAIQAGANVLFVDLLPAADAESFRVIDHRMVQGLEHVRGIAEKAGVNLIL